MNETKTCLYLDLKGWSKFTDEEIIEFVQNVFPDIKDLLENNEYINTWGDATMVIFGNTESAILSALKIRDYYKKPNHRLLELIDCRIALHIGDVRKTYNSLTERDDYFGYAIHMAARLEPITSPGKISCTDSVKTSCKSNKFKFINKGKKKLPKDFGEFDVYNIFWPKETNCEENDNYNEASAIDYASEADMEIILTEWVAGGVSYSIAYYYGKIDQKLNFPKGTTKKLLPNVIKDVGGMIIAKNTDSIFMLKPINPLTRGLI